MNKHLQLHIFLMLTALCGMSFFTYAQDETGADVSAEEKAEAEPIEGDAASDAATPRPAIYLPLKPAFVVNYGGAGRLRYLKTEISVRLEHTDVANSVRHHMPFIRNNLVLLFARQTEEIINSQEGREQLRQDALEEIRKVVLAEDGAEGVLDVYFSTFIVQN